MALNRFMHPRNPYKNNKLNFKQLALEHEGFRKVAKQSMEGNVTLDFKDAACLRALSITLLKSDFDLEVDFPVDRLIPAIPQRMNYILWLEDIFSNKNSTDITGIDVGCGSSCIYPLLGNKNNKWRFIATEVDPINIKYAKDNVAANNREDQITVLKADDTLLKLAVDHYIQASINGGEGLAVPPLSIDFCMCNPPFYDADEAAACRDVRPEPKHICTAGPSEKTVLGGEVKFVMKMVDESLELRDKVKVYTSMVGKKSSLSKIKQHLKANNITNISTTEFCQGRTMRWAIAWSFDNNIIFPKSLFQQERAKGKSVFTHIIPSEIECCTYDVPDLTHYFKSVLLKQLEMKSTTLHQDMGEFICIVTARKNTWSNSRRKRRQEKFKLLNKSEHLDSDTAKGGAVDQPAPKRPKVDDELKSKASESEAVSVTTDKPSSSSCEDSSSAEEKPLITFSLELKLEGIHIKLNLKLIDCDQKDMIHQILQYFKNRLV